MTLHCHDLQVCCSMDEIIEASMALAFKEKNLPGVLRYKWIALAAQQTIVGDAIDRTLVFERSHACTIKQWRMYVRRNGRIQKKG